MSKRDLPSAAGLIAAKSIAVWPATRRPITRPMCSAASMNGRTAIRAVAAREGAEKLRNYLKARAKELGLGEMRINQAGCLDRCGIGADHGDLSGRRLVQLPQHRGRRGNLAAVSRQGERVERLMLRPSDKLPADRAANLSENDHRLCAGDAGGKVGVAVIRISGPDSGAALRALTRQDPPPPRLRRDGSSGSRRWLITGPHPNPPRTGEGFHRTHVSSPIWGGRWGSVADDR